MFSGRDIIVEHLGCAFDVHQKRTNTDSNQSGQRAIERSAP